MTWDELLKILIIIAAICLALLFVLPIMMDKIFISMKDNLIVPLISQPIKKAAADTAMGLVEGAVQASDVIPPGSLRDGAFEVGHGLREGVSLKERSSRPVGTGFNG
jgi:hypothetical protein